MTLTDAEKNTDKKEKPFTKVIIRRLPPTMTLVQFLDQVSPVPDYNYIYHVKGDMSLGENAFSRVYINFMNPEDVYGFKEKFDNYVFVDNKGHEYTAVVEFAPFQKIPKKRGKVRMDPKCNTIESDTYYMEFVANLNKPVEQEAKPEYTLQLSERADDKNKDVTTPLLEFIKNKRAQKQKIREVRREERERRKKEYEKQKYGKYYDDKSYEEKSIAKVYGKKPNFKSPKSESPREQIKSEPSEEKLNKSPKERKDEKQSPENKPKEKKIEEKKEKKEIKPRFPKKDYTEVKEYNKRDDYSHRDFRPRYYDEYKKEDTKTYPKKSKKYSEKREERKIEAQKAVLKQIENEAKENKSTPKEDNDEKNEPKANSKSDNEKDVKIQNSNENIKEASTSSSEKELNIDEKKKDNADKNEASSSNSRRIRNKDRPTIPLYRPGMLSKRKQPDAEENNSKTEANTESKKE